MWVSDSGQRGPIGPQDHHSVRAAQTVREPVHRAGPHEKSDPTFWSRFNTNGARGSAPLGGGLRGLILGAYSPLSMAAMTPVSPLSLSSAMEPSER
jgi:hypothetical protein